MSRLIPLTGTEANRQAVASDILPGEIHTTSDQVRLFIRNAIVAPVWLGVVGSDDEQTNLRNTHPRGCWPGDTVQRSDLGDAIYLCISRNGQELTDWVLLGSPLGGAPSTASSAAPLGPTTYTSTATGTVNDLDFTNADVVWMNNAATTTLTGFLSGVDGQQVIVVAKGAGQVNLTNEGGTSSAVDRIKLPILGNLALQAGAGAARLVYDLVAQRWRVISYQLGSLDVGAFPASGLQHYWRFTEQTNTSNRADAVGSATLNVKNNPPMCGAPKELRAGLKAVYFNSGKLYALKCASTGTSPNVGAYTSGFSAGGWVKVLPVSGQDTYDCMMGRYAAAGNTTDQWMIQRDSNGNAWNVLLRMSDGTYPSPTWLNVDRAPIGEWCHLLATVDYTTRLMCFYINGVLYASSNYGVGLTVNANAAAQIFCVGAYAETGNAAIQHSNSEMAGLGIWNRALTAAEVLILYNNGNGLAY